MKSIVILFFMLPILLSSTIGETVGTTNPILITGWEDVTWEKPLIVVEPKVNVASFIDALPKDSCGGTLCNFASVSIWGCKGAAVDVYVFTDVKP